MPRYRVAVDQLIHGTIYVDAEDERDAFIRAEDLWDGELGRIDYPIARSAEIVERESGVTTADEKELFDGE
jgi:hypothetical protein